MRYCFINFSDRVELQLYIQRGNTHYVIVQGSLLKVLDEVEKLSRFIRYEITNEIPGIDKNAAIEEVGRILNVWR